MEHLQPLIKRIRTTPVTHPPQPWQIVASVVIGGLLEIGFAENSDLLLIVSSQGRGLINCKDGEKIARDREIPFSKEASWYDPIKLTARAIGPLQHQVIQLAGLSGGGLPLLTFDGWSAVSVTLEWPEVHLLLVHPWSSIYMPEGQFAKIGVEQEVRAFGFSYTGQTLVIATSSNLTIFHRG